MKSKITGGTTHLLFTAKVLNKYDVKYFQCTETGFIQTEEPYWLEESYSSAITKLDLGLLKRNIEFANITAPLIAQYYNPDKYFLDYAGGYGLFTRLMRDEGFDFYTTDKFCQNIFAENFDLVNNIEKKSFEILTAFEVFEHLTDPYIEIEEMLSYSENVLFSTEVPPLGIKNPNEWWYFSPQIGQHVSFYTIESLEYIAKKFNKNLCTNGLSMHLFTAKKLEKNPLIAERETFFIRKIRKYLKKIDQKKLRNRQSLLQQDWEEAKNQIGK